MSEENLSILLFRSPVPTPGSHKKKDRLRSTDFSANVSYWSADDVSHKLDYEQSLFFLGPSSKTPRKWPSALLKARDGRGTRAAALVSPLTKSEEKERLLAVRLAVYTKYPDSGSASDWPYQVENSLQPRHYPDLGARHRYKYPVWLYSGLLHLLYNCSKGIRKTNSVS